MREKRRALMKDNPSKKYGIRGNKIYELAMS